MRAQVKFFFFLLLLSLYLCLFKIPFPGVDDACYKEAAYRLSQGLGLSAPAMQGKYPGSEKVFLFYPPTHSVLLAGWFWLFGFSIASSLLFSLLVCGGIAAFCVALCRDSWRGCPAGLLYGLVFAAWTLALTGIHRPDPLYVLFGLALLWVFEKKLPCPLSDGPTHFLLVLLIALGIGISPGMGLFMLPYLGAVFTSAFGFTRRSFLLFLGYALLAVTLALCAWALVFRAEPQLFWSHFLRRALTLRVAEMILKDLATWIFYLKGYFNLFLCLPLMLLLFGAALGWALRDIRNAARRTFLIQLSVLSGLWIFFLLVRTKGTYLTMIHIFLIALCGKVFPRWILELKGLSLQRLWRGAAWLGVFVAVAPFVRMASLPLTWEAADSYSGNAKRIASQIPEDAAVLTDVRFWYLLAPRNRIYDAYFSHSRIDKVDYVLVASGGSGRPDAAWAPPFTAAERQYLNRHFRRRDSTLSEIPNRLLGFPIARSRWSYRFDLYERKERRAI